MKMKRQLLLAGPGTGKTTRIKELIKHQQDTEKVLVVSFTNATIHDLLKSFSDAGIGITAKNCNTLHKYALKINHQKNLHILNASEISILEFYSRQFNINFDDLCKVLGCITFEHMITQTSAYIKSNPVYLDSLADGIELLVVDEFQDFNPPERELIDLISKKVKEVIILGDDDQCIYEFKDADTDGIINLYNDQTVIKLNHHNMCHRCPDCVVNACSYLINKNKRRVLKEWIPSGKPGNIEFKQFMTQQDTADYITKAIETIKNSEPASSIMILSAVEVATNDILSSLETKGIQYTNLWSPRVDFEKMRRVWEVRVLLGNKKVLNFLFLIHSSIRPNKKALGDIKKTISKDLSFQALLDLAEKGRFVESRFLGLLNRNPSLADIVSKNEYSFLSDYLTEEYLDDNLENLGKIISEPLPFDPKGINALSIHKSKGLQADYVFIVGMVEGILPNVLRGFDSVEAQRRLLFVGMSRAKTALYLLSTVEWDGQYVHKVDKKQFTYDWRSKKYKGKTSTFINELNLNS